MPRRILITAALPYANGDIHLGHLVEYIQADIWTRYQKLRGHECYFVCADDAHGTPVMLRAEAENVAPEELIARMQKNHLRDFSGFHVAFDNYHSTHSPENEKRASDIFRKLRERGHIAEKRIRQLYDEEKNMFLPDRYVRGECPRCAATDQYGDSCEKCGAAYSSAELKNPLSVLSGKPPVMRESLHYFLRLNALRDELAQWTQESIPAPAALPAFDDAEFANALKNAPRIPRLQKEATNKMREWLDSELRDWDVSRDAPYFGFRIPDIAEEKYFYVWLDAPIGYMASFENLCNRCGLDFDTFWREEAEHNHSSELYHFIGKDILYFHALFWPAMLKNSGYRRPTRLFAHGFLTVNGEKMSKSRGTFITAEHYLACRLNPEFLRYYYACKINPSLEDLDLNLTDFAARANSDLVGKLINIPSRVAGFLHKFFDGTLDDVVDINDKSETARHLQAMVVPALAAAESAKDAFEERRFHDAMRSVMRAADAINAHIDEYAPWQMAKQFSPDGDNRELQALCSGALRAFHILMTILKPVLPEMATRAEEFLNTTLTWPQSLQLLPAQHAIGKYHHLLTRLSDKQINALIQPQESAATKTDADTNADAGTDDIIDIKDFARANICVALVTEAHEVPNADKLLRLILDVGDGQQRQVFAGLRKHCDASSLVGKRVLYLRNLKTRTMRFGDSEGMVLAATDGSGDLWLPEVPPTAPPGARLK